MDELAEHKIGALVRDIAFKELDYQLDKGRATLLLERKKIYVIYTLGTLIYDLSLLTGVSVAAFASALV